MLQKMLLCGVHGSIRSLFLRCCRLHIVEIHCPLHYVPAVEVFCQLWQQSVNFLGFQFRTSLYWRLWSPLGSRWKCKMGSPVMVASFYIIACQQSLFQNFPRNSICMLLWCGLLFCSTQYLIHWCTRPGVGKCHCMPEISVGCV